MNYSINPTVFGSLFAVPTEITDKHLKLASGTQLKVLLLFIRHSNIENVQDVIRSCLSISEDELNDALEYWAQCGILLKNGATLEQQPPQKPTAEPMLVAKPNREEAVRRAAQSKDIQFMLSEVQAKLGRLISQAETATLIWIHDNQGLPVTVILMSIEYAKSVGKTSFSYIEKLCIDWAKNDIVTLEAAEERLNSLYKKNKAWSIVRSSFGIPERRPSAREQSYADKWVNDYGFGRDLLRLAYDRCVDSASKLSLPYINTILEKWHSAGVKSIKDVVALGISDAKKTGGSAATSYDINKLKSRFNNFD